LYMISFARVYGIMVWHARGRKKLIKLVTSSDDI